MEWFTMPITTWLPTVIETSPGNDKKHCFGLAQLFTAVIFEFIYFQHPHMLSTSFAMFSTQVSWIVLSRVFAILWSWSHLVSPTSYFVHWRRKCLVLLLCITYYPYNWGRKENHKQCFVSAPGLHSVYSWCKGTAEQPVWLETHLVLLVLHEAA